MIDIYNDFSREDYFNLKTGKYAILITRCGCKQVVRCDQEHRGSYLMPLKNKVSASVFSGEPPDVFEMSKTREFKLNSFLSDGKVDIRIFEEV